MKKQKWVEIHSRKHDAIRPKWKQHNVEESKFSKGNVRDAMTGVWRGDLLEIRVWADKRETIIHIQGEGLAELSALVKDMKFYKDEK